MNNKQEESGAPASPAPCDQLPLAPAARPSPSRWTVFSQAVSQK